jgi:hypothetical protein
VIDRKTGAIYGMIVATSAGLQEGYIIPLKDILQDIRKNMPQVSIRLHMRLNAAVRLQHRPAVPTSPDQVHYDAKSPKAWDEGEASATSTLHPGLENDSACSKAVPPEEPWNSKVIFSIGKMVRIFGKFIQQLTLVDGGGIRGYASLLILTKLMECVNVEEEKSSRRMANVDSPGIEDTPCRFLPAQYFDLIIGTSTGGLIAIMLGRLRMNVDDCIEEYINFSEKIFGHPRIFSLRGPIWWPRPKYDHKRLEEAVQDVVFRRLRPKGQNTSLASNDQMCRT